MPLLALTHVPSPDLEKCQLTHLRAQPIDYPLAIEQHRGYCEALRECGARVLTLDLYRQLPDCVFVEDTAVVLDEMAILCPMGVASRRNEPPGIEIELKRHRPVYPIPLPATLEGGDVLRVGRELLVGLSSRTNAAGVEALTNLVRPHGYSVRAVTISKCLHLKSACTALPDERLLVNPELIDIQTLGKGAVVPIHPEEPWAADVAFVGNHVCVAAGHPRTADKIERLGFPVRRIELSEFAKAEGGVTCLSLLFEAEPGATS